MKALQPYFIPPEFDDQEKTRAASLLYPITWVLLASSTLMAGLAWSQRQVYAAVPLIILAMTESVFLWTIKKGMVKLPGLAQPIVVLSVVVVILFLGNGLRDIAMLGYVVPLLLAGLFAGKIAPLVMAGIEGATVWFLHRAELNGRLDSPLSQSTDWIDVVSIASLLVMIGFLISTLIRYMEGQVLQLKASQKQLIHLNEMLESSYDITLESWARALEIRDREVIGHTKRVTELTLELARDFGIKGPDLEHIRRGAILHDVGKMGIPDEVYYKAEQLNPEETAIMRKHVDYASDLLGDIEFLGPAMKIPLYHHERWDGAGYPGKLKGAEIPLEARIFAVVDVWDALISRRPYREAWGKAEALDYIKGQRGKHFDPEVVDRFLTMINGNA